ncbi:MAG: arsenite methyltransferase [Pseudomonadota bacterium]
MSDCSNSSNVENDRVRNKVRERYGKVAETGHSDLGGYSTSNSCCGTPDVDATSKALGYSLEELAAVPGGANLGLGCGNPQAIASIKNGETVLDLGSGAGFDAFLAAKQVGDVGQVIGVDMTPSMISKARNNANESSFTNVDFRLGEIENLPVANDAVDVIISNCVINLSPNKQRVFTEAFRVLKPKGRLAISDVVATAELPDEMKSDVDLLTGCMSGASLITDLESMIQKAGFQDIKIQPKNESKEFIKEWASEHNVTDYVVSATIEATKA